MPKGEHFCMTITTFDKDAKLDESAFRRWLHRYRDEGIGIYVGSGGNGEGHALSPAELDRIYRIAVEELKGKVPVHANLPEEHTALQTVAQAKIAKKAGIDCLHMYVLEARHGMKPTDRELITYFDDIFAEIDSPVCVSVNPTIGAVPKPAVIAEIANKHKQVTSIRLSHQPELYLIDLRSMIKRDLAYYYQFNTGAFAPLYLGATLFSAEANIVVKTFRRYIDAFEAGDTAKMAEELTHVRRFYGYCKPMGPNPRWMKMAMRGLKLPGGEGIPRRPYLMPKQEEIDSFMKGLLALRIPEIDEYARAAGLKLPD
jgi:4-hydroxy-tetrahydrodipicolinate synthase